MNRPARVVLDARVVSGSGGGPDKTILNSPRYLTRDGYRMICAYMHPPRDKGFDVLRSNARARGAPLYSIPDRGAWDWRVIPQLLEVCRRERVSIWHGHDYKSDALGLILRRFWPMQLVTTVHGWGVRVRRMELYARLDRLCLPYYDHVICVSDDIHQSCLGCGVPENRCVVIENGIELDDYRRRQTPEQAKTRLGLPVDVPLVGAVGRLSKEKGFDLLVRAANRLMDQGLDFRLVIIGEGSERVSLERLLSESGHAEKILLAGFQSDMLGWYEAMDLFVLSSLSEGCPNVLLEAMAMEIPVVATRVAGVPRMVRDGCQGLLVPSGSEAELSGAMDRLLRDGELRVQLRRAGYERVAAEYSFARRMRRIGTLYDRLLDGHPA